MQEGYINQQEAASKIGCSEEIVAQLKKMKLLSGKLANKKLILLEASVNRIARTKGYIDGTEGIEPIEDSLLTIRERTIFNALLAGATYEQLGEELSLPKERIWQIAEKTLAKVGEFDYTGASSTIEYLERENASLRHTILSLKAIIAGYERRFGK